jgi:hypothetical protein
VIGPKELHWDDDDRSFTLRGWRFVTVHGGGGHGDLVPGENCFVFYKTHALVDQYLAYFNGLVEPVRSDNVLEIGLYQGGSMPFWFEALEPRKHVGIDIERQRETPYFEKYASQEGRRQRLETHWGIDQANPRQLAEVVEGSFGGEPIDVVIDDASHLYRQTRASFELLFPRVRPGGLYIIEDWAWFHWRGIEESFRGQVPLTRLVFDLIEALGSNSHQLILSIHLCSGFAAVRRGWALREQLEPLSLDRAIYRHPG